MTGSADQPPKSPLESLRLLAGAVHNLSPQLQSTLGIISVEGTDAETRAWIDDLSGVVDEIQLTLDGLRRSVREIPVSTPSPTESGIETDGFTDERQPADNAAALQPASDITAQQRQTDAKPETEQLPELNGLMRAVMAYAQKHAFFSMSDLRREVPEISVLSDDEYKAFRSNFPRERESIVPYIFAKEGTHTKWVEKGSSNRSKEYTLAIISRPKEAGSTSAPVNKVTKATTIVPAAVKQAKVKPADPTISRQPRPAEERTRARDTRADKPVPIKLSEADQALAKSIIFTAKLVDYIGRWEAKQRVKGIKWTLIARKFSEELSITEAEAQFLVKTLETNNLLYYVGDHKGTRKLTTHPTDGVVRKNKGPEARQSQRRNEAVRIQKLKELHGFKIIKYLIDALNWNQTIKPAAIAEALDYEIDVNDVNPVCRLLQADGLAWAKKPGHGSKKPRNLMTWGYTDKGKSFVENELRKADPRHQ